MKFEHGHRTARAEQGGRGVHAYQRCLPVPCAGSGTCANGCGSAGAGCSTQLFVAACGAAVGSTLHLAWEAAPNITGTSQEVARERIVPRQ